MSAPAWETPRDFVAERWPSLSPVAQATHAVSVELRDRAILAALTACFVPGDDAATVENVRGVIAALRGGGLPARVGPSEEQIEAWAGEASNVWLATHAMGAVVRRVLVLAGVLRGER